MYKKKFQRDDVNEAKIYVIKTDIYFNCQLCTQNEYSGNG